VYADTRTANHLLPFKFPKHALTADLNVFRRAKSDEEVSSIQRMAGILQASRKHARDEQHFRGTVDSLNYRHAVQERAENEFTVKRYGLQDELGRSVELSSVEPHTLDWKARMLRVDGGCRAVEKQLREGVTGMDIDKTFRSHLDPIADVMYGSVLHHTGYQPWEDDLEVDVLKPYDVLTICPIVGDTQGNSVPYMHSVHAITDQQFRGATASYDALFRGDLPRFTENVKKVMNIWRAMEEEPTEDFDGNFDGNFDKMLEGGIDAFITDLYELYKSWPGWKEYVKKGQSESPVESTLLKRLIQMSAIVENKIVFDDKNKGLVALAIGFVVAPLLKVERVEQTPFRSSVLRYVSEDILQPWDKALDETVLDPDDEEVEEEVVERASNDEQVIELKTKIVQLNEELNGVIEREQEIVRLREEEIRLQERVSEMVASLGVKENELKQMQQDISIQSTTNEKMKSELADAVGERDQLRSDLNDLQSQMNSVRQTSEEKVQGLLETIKRLKANNEALTLTATAAADEGGAVGKLQSQLLEMMVELSKADDKLHLNKDNYKQLLTVKDSLFDAFTTVTQEKNKLASDLVAQKDLFAQFTMQQQVPTDALFYEISYKKV